MNLITVHNPDIIFGTESWLKADIFSGEVFPTGYSVYCHDRVDGYAGVFIACIETLISCELKIDHNFSELIACEIKLPNSSQLTVCSIYRPQSSSTDYLTNLCKRLKSIRSLYPNSALWIAGDVNRVDINWKNNCVVGHQNLLSISNAFLEFLSNNGPSQVVEALTRGSNILDIFVSNRPSLIEPCTVIAGISDHKILLTT